MVFGWGGAGRSGARRGTDTYALLRPPTEINVGYTSSLWPKLVWMPFAFCSIMGAVLEVRPALLPTCRTASQLHIFPVWTAPLPSLGNNVQCAIAPPRPVQTHPWW